MRLAVVPGVTGTETPSPSCPPSVSETPTARRGRSTPGREQDVDVRRDHGLHAVDAREVQQFFHLRVLAAQVGAQRFDRDVLADLVAELEAVGDGLRGPVDPKLATTDLDSLDACGKRGVAEAVETHRRMLDLAILEAARHREVDGMRDLRGEAVVGQRRDETEDRLWHLPCDDREVWFRWRCVCKLVDASAEPQHGAALHHRRQRAWMDACGLGLLRAEDAPGASEDGRGLWNRCAGGGAWHAERYCYRYRQV